MKLLTLEELKVLFDTTTISNADDGVTVKVFPVTQGYMARLIDDDSGNIVGSRIFKDEGLALAYAHLIVGVEL